MIQLREFSIPALDLVSHEKGLTFKIGGEWVAKEGQKAHALCNQILKKSFSTPLIFDFMALKHFDTYGVWLVQQTLQALEEKGYKVTTKNESEAFLTLSAYVKSCHKGSIPPSSSSSFLREWIEGIGKTTLDLTFLGRDLLIFLGHVTEGLGGSFLHPHRLYFRSILSHMEKFGVNAIPIVSLISMALGVVLAYQGEEQLRRFGAEIYTINLVSISIVREVGILITAILVAGRTGSAITAQLGIMKINQEVDALTTLGMKPMDVLIIPRIVALILIMPCLAFVADLAGLLGGGIMAVLSLDVSPQLYINRIGEAITMGGFWIGILKAPLFGAIIGIISCFEGMRVKDTAESVGICTTRSVVEGIFFVTLADAFLSIFFSKIGI